VIKQAVIFCGGLGKRLNKITKKIPKPMVIVQNKPFLEHLIIQLKKNGIKEIILLIGYKGEIIKNYFLNGKKFKIKIKYSFLPPRKKTGSRLYKIKNKLDSKFVLMYCDNYSSINLHKINSHLSLSKKKMIICLSKKKNGNCTLNKDMSINYDLNRNKKNQFVEIGYMIMKKELLKNLNKKDENFSDFIHELSKKRLIQGYVQENGYTSISDQKRLKKTRKLFSNNNYILIDRDGVINKKSSKQRYITQLRHLKINTFQCEKLPKAANYICITNQAGVSTGDLNIKDLKQINQKIKYLLKKRSLKIIKFYISTHHFTSNSFFRKPRPGLFFRASKFYNFVLDKTFYIGDDLRDIEAAYNANTFIFYVGKKKLTAEQKRKYRYTLLKKDIKKTFDEKIRYEF